MYQSRWGYHPCSLAEFRELRDLWRAVLARRRAVAAWRRWNAKAPHNRRSRGEPPLPSVACRTVPRPSGKVDVEFAGPSGNDLRRLQEAYRLARRPRPSPAEVEEIPVTTAEVRLWRAAIGG